MGYSGLFLFVWMLILAPTSKETSIHEFYVSVSDLTFNDDTKKYDLICRVFKDDLEIALNNINPKHGNIVEDPLNVHQIKKYILDHLNLKVDGQVKSLDFASFVLEGSEPTETVTTTLVTQENFNSYKHHITISNTVLFEVYDDQINMIRIKLGGKRKSKNLDRGNAVFEYNPK